MVSGPFDGFGQGAHPEFWTKNQSQQPCAAEKWHLDEIGKSEKTFGTSYA